MVVPWGSALLQFRQKPLPRNLQFRPRKIVGGAQAGAVEGVEGVQHLRFVEPAARAPTGMSCSFMGDQPGWLALRKEICSFIVQKSYRTPTRKSPPVSR